MTLPDLYSRPFHRPFMRRNFKTTTFLSLCKSLQKIIASSPRISDFMNNVLSNRLTGNNRGRTRDYKSCWCFTNELITRGSSAMYVRISQIATIIITCFECLFRMQFKFITSDLGKNKTSKQNRFVTTIHFSIKRISQC